MNSLRMSEFVLLFKFYSFWKMNAPVKNNSPQKFKKNLHTELNLQRRCFPGNKRINQISKRKNKEILEIVF